MNKIVLGLSMSVLLAALTGSHASDINHVQTATDLSKNYVVSFDSIAGPQIQFVSLSAENVANWLVSHHIYERKLVAADAGTILKMPEDSDGNTLFLKEGSPEFDKWIKEHKNKGN